MSDFNKMLGVDDLNEILRECDPDGVRKPVTWPERLAKVAVVTVKVCIVLLLKEAHARK